MRYYHYDIRGDVWKFHAKAGVSMKKLLIVLLILSTVAGIVSAGGASEGASKPITFVWYPNESGDELKASREAVGKIIEDALGRKVIHKLTTDYVISIEAIANKQAHMGWYGAEGFVEANKKNPRVLPLVVNSGASGTLDDAIYYSWLNVKLGNEGMYKAGDKYSLDNIAGKKFGFVSTSSTSGFKVPGAVIAAYFSKKTEWAGLKSADLLEGGAGKLFNTVLYGNSHQGSAVNLLMGKVDVAAFCDSCVNNYVDFVSGTPNTAGAVYQVKKDAVDPFTSLQGQQFVVISVTPVLNGPMAINTEMFSTDELIKLNDAFTSEKTAKNELIFVPKTSTIKGLGFKAGEKFLPVQNRWYDPIRELSK